MRHPRSIKQTAAVSLFPFLAVLICTMGALIVLLVIMVQQARVEADVITDNQRVTEATGSENHKAQQQIVRWQLEILENSREEMKDRLADERLRLSGLEDHVRRLEDELSRLARDAKATGDPLHVHQEHRVAMGAELQRLRNEIATQQQQLEDAKRSLENQPPSFSILPYRGPQGTLRRPIYVECLSDRIILQPEGIVLTSDDFEGPQGSANPLAASLRATREYLAESGLVTERDEPYPLLIVRSGGSQAYAVARRAMKSWDAEFGYELVNDDLELAYPPADPVLAARLRKTVKQARERRRFLARVAPSRFGKSDRSGGLVAKPRSGGFVSHGGSPGSRELTWDSDPPDSTFAPDRRGSPRQSSRSDSKAGTGQPGLDGRSAPTETLGGSTRPGADGQRFENSASAADGEQYGAPSEQNASGQSGQGDVGNQFAVTVGLAQRRGRNWGVPNATRGAIGFTRPIRVACFVDRLVILPNRASTQPPQVIPVSGPMRSSIDKFVSTVWQYMNSWGIAGPAAYWKPLLTVEVAPGADGRFNELKTLLDGSGMDVERKVP